MTVRELRDRLYEIVRQSPGQSADDDEVVVAVETDGRATRFGMVTKTQIVRRAEPRESGRTDPSGLVILFM